MKAFITGGTGFLGSNLVQELDHAGWDIVALHRKGSDLSVLKKCRSVEFTIGDITDLKSLRQSIPEGVDAVFHVAGSVANLPPREEKSRYRVNQLGTRNVVTACLEKRVGRLIYTSTVVTYDWRAQRPLTESSPPARGTKDAYAASKQLAELEVDQGRDRGLDVVYLHPSAVFGAYDRGAWSKLFLELQRGLPIPVLPPGGGSVCHARPVARAHLAAFHQAPRGAHYILGGPDVTWMEVATEIAALLGKPRPWGRIPAPLFKLYAEVECRISTLIGREPTLTPHAAFTLCEEVYSDSSRAIRELGYQPSSLKEMLTDCYQWMVAEGMLPPRTARLDR